jgi:hypothetical protein
LSSRELWPFTLKKKPRLGFAAENLAMTKKKWEMVVVGYEYNIVCQLTHELPSFTRYSGRGRSDKPIFTKERWIINSRRRATKDITHNHDALIKLTGIIRPSPWMSYHISQTRHQTFHPNCITYSPDPNLTM